MKKLSLYVFLILMFCDIAYATPAETLVVGIIIAILTSVAMIVTDSMIPIYIVYGIGIIWTVLFWGSVLSKSNKKERKQDIDNNIGDSVGLWIAPILFLVFLFFTDPLNPAREKIKTTKKEYKSMVTYITIEMRSCSLGETTTMDGNLTCGGRTADSVIAAAVIATKDVQMNPYELDESAVTSGGTNTSDSDAGYIRLSVSGENIIIKTCHTKPCATKNQSSKTIALQ